MNKYQSARPTKTQTGLFPVVELRPGDKVLIEATLVGRTKRSIGKLADTVQSMEGAIYATVMSARHVGDGIIAVLVEHPHAIHPTGWEEIKIIATNKVLVSREIAR